MTTWNTTYNFNQPSMNFGKAMLYGAFGQLTGMFGGGCFGGGYGMGSYGMGMGGSLFSMMGGFGGFGGFGMYGCGIPDSYVGAQCGLAATNVLFSAIGTHLSSRRAEKAAAQQAAQTASNNVDTLTKEIKALEAKKADTDTIEKNLDSKYKSAIDSTTNTFNTLSAEQKKLNGNDTEAGSVNNLYKKYSDLKAQKDAGDTTVTQTDVDNAKAAYDLAVKQKAELDASSGERSVTAAKAKMDEAIKAKNDAIQEEQEKIQKEIGKKQDDLANAQKEIEKAKAQEKLNKKCDTDDEYSGIVGKFENGKFTKNGKDLKIDDTNKKEAEYAFNYKFRQYCICGTTTDADKTKKKALRDELLALYDAFGGAATSDMSKKKEILESGKKAFGLN